MKSMVLPLTLSKRTQGMDMYKTKRHKSTKRPGVVMRHGLKEYLAALRARRLSPKTLLCYGHALNSFGRFLKGRKVRRLQDVTAADLQAWRQSLTDRNLAPPSMEAYLRAVRQFFDWLEAGQRLFINPAAGLVIPRPPRKLQPVPTEEEMQRFLSQPDTRTPHGLRDRALLETAYATGARREEMARLPVSALDLDNNCLRLYGKGSRERVVPLGTQAIHWLRCYLAEARPRLLRPDPDEPALWLNGAGRRLGYFGFQRMVWRYARAAGLATPLTFHGLRRACATHMLRHGAHPAQLQLLLGHSSLKTLGQYLRVSIADLQQAHAQTPPGA
jgi:integrase/recombinase XerD